MNELFIYNPSYYLSTERKSWRVIKNNTNAFPRFFFLVYINKKKISRPWCNRRRLLSIICKMFQVLVDGIDWLIDVVCFGVVGVDIDSLGEICRNRIRYVRAQKPLQKLSHQFPATGCDQARPVLDLHKNSLEVLTHSYNAKFYQKITKLKARSFGFDLRLLLRCVDWWNVFH